MRAKRALLIVLCLFSAFLIQTGIGAGLIKMSELIWPSEFTFLGGLGFFIIPHPLSFGLLLLPITTFLIYHEVKKILTKRGVLNAS